MDLYGFNGSERVPARQTQIWRAAARRQIQIRLFKHARRAPDSNLTVAAHRGAPQIQIQQLRTGPGRIPDSDSTPAARRGVPQIQILGVSRYGCGEVVQSATPLFSEEADSKLQGRYPQDCVTIGSATPTVLLAL